MLRDLVAERDAELESLRASLAVLQRPGAGRKRRRAGWFRKPHTTDVNPAERFPSGPLGWPFCRSRVSTPG